MHQLPDMVEETSPHQDALLWNHRTLGIMRFDEFPEKHKNKNPGYIWKIRNRSIQDFTTEKARKQWSNTFKFLKENYCQYMSSVSISSQTTNQRWKNKNMFQTRDLAEKKDEEISQNGDRRDFEIKVYSLCLSSLIC